VTIYAVNPCLEARLDLFGTILLDSEVIDAVGSIHVAFRKESQLPAVVD
jgi:hypothetical protein